MSRTGGERKLGRFRWSGGGYELQWRFFLILAGQREAPSAVHRHLAASPSASRVTSFCLAGMIVSRYQERERERMEVCLSHGKCILASRVDDTCWTAWLRTTSITIATVCLTQSPTTIPPKNHTRPDHRTAMTYQYILHILPERRQCNRQRFNSERRPPS